MKKYSKFLAILLAVAMVLPGMAGIAEAAPEDAVVRVYGDTRVGTAVDASKNVAYPDGAESVVLAGRNGTVDALTGSILADAKDAPILLTLGNKLSEETEAELERLNPENIFILGGESAIGKSVEETLEADYNVKRVAGDNREGTALAVAEEVGVQTEHVFLALGMPVVEGDSLADALAVGPASANEDIPVLLARPGRLADTTKDALKELEVEKITIVGGKSAITEDTKEDLEEEGYEIVDRLAGDRREDTALAIAEEFFADSDKAVIANGRKDADALVGGYLGAMKDAPMLLTENYTDRFRDDVKEYLETKVDKAWVFGGPTVINEDVFAMIETAVEGEEVEEGLKVESVSAIDATTVDVTLSDGTTHEVTVDELKEGVETKLVVEIDGNEYVVTVTWLGNSEDIAKDLKAAEADLEAKREAETAADKALDKAQKDYDHAVAKGTAQEQADAFVVLENAKEAAEKATAERQAAKKEVEDLTVRLTKAKLVEAAEKAVIVAEKTRAQSDITKAEGLIEKLSETASLSDVQAQLGVRLNEVVDINNAEVVVENAEKFVADKKFGSAQKDHDRAKALVEDLKDGQAKTELLARLEAVEEAIAADDQVKAEKEATDWVVKAEKELKGGHTGTAQNSHNTAKGLVEALEAGTVKTDLTERLATVQAGLDKVAADKAAAADVDKMITAIKSGDNIKPDNVVEVKKEVEAARAAYDALTEEQQDLVKYYESGLVAREDRVKVVEDAVVVAANKKAAEKVSTAINGLVDPDAGDKKDDFTGKQIKAVEDARVAYDALNAEAKKLVPNKRIVKLESLELKMSR